LRLADRGDRRYQETRMTDLTVQITALKAQVDALTTELEYLKATFVPEPRFFWTATDELGGLAPRELLHGSLHQSRDDFPSEYKDRAAATLASMKPHEQVDAFRAAVREHVLTELRANMTTFADHHLKKGD
jgi:hypothetical protein